jgi:hypothetical protein
LKEIVGLSLDFGAAMAQLSTLGGITRMKKYTNSDLLLAGLLIAIFALASWLVVTRWQLAAHSLVLQQFANADRVVLGWGSSPVITVTGDKAREIVHVITTAKQLTGSKGLPPTIGIMLLNEVRFYQDTNYLGKIYTSCGLFSTGGFDGYEAEKGKLEPLVDEPFRKALEEEQRGKAQVTPLK